MRFSERAKQSLKISTLATLIGASAFYSACVAAHPGGHERIMSLNEQIEHEPKNAYLVIKRAQELIEEDKNYQDAKTDLERAHALGATTETSYEYNFVMGLYHKYQKGFKTATPFFKQCIKLDNNHLQCHRALADSVQATDGDKQAIAVLTNLIKTSKSAETDDYFHLAQLLEKENQSHKALMFLDQAQAKFGSLPHFEKYAIKIETENSNFQRALERHISLKPYFGKTPQWQYEQGQLFQNLGKALQAKTAYKQALALIDNKKKKNQASEALKNDIEAKLASLNN